MTDDADSFFGFVVGLYVGGLVAPAGTIGAALAVTADPAILLATFLLLGVGAIAGVARIAGRESVAVRLGSTRWTWLAPLAGVGYLAVLFAGIDGPASALVVGVSMLGILAGFVVGTGLVFAADNRHARAALAESEQCAEFSARGPARDREVTKWVVGVLMVGGLVGLAAGVALDYESRWVFHVLVGAGAGLMGATTERTFVIADAGLRVGTPVHKRIRPWSAYESYSLTDDALVLHRAGWSMWGLRDVRRDATEVEDPEEVAAALDRFLPREPRGS